MTTERHTVTLLRDGYGDPPWLDTAISWTLLERTAAGVSPETFRLYRPARVLAFGPSDRVTPGYDEARAAASAAGYAPVERLAGGRAAVFHEDTIAFGWTAPDSQARLNIRPRFEFLAELLREALERVGLDARVGAVPGEYCPGDYSVNAGGRTKIIGIGQRVFPTAAHTGGVIVVGGSDRIREVLVPVYAALGLDWDPASVGSVRDEDPSLTWDDVAASVLGVLARHFDVREATIDPAIVAGAEESGFGSRRVTEDEGHSKTAIMLD